MNDQITRHHHVGVFHITLIQSIGCRIFTFDQSTIEQINAQARHPGSCLLRGRQLGRDSKSNQRK